MFASEEDEDECSASFCANKCHMGPRDVEALAFALRHSVVQFLDLSGCTLGGSVWPRCCRACDGL